MSDIRYKWNDGLNSVQVSGDVSLPQFKVLSLLNASCMFLSVQTESEDSSISDNVRPWGTTSNQTFHNTTEWLRTFDNDKYI